VDSGEADHLVPERVWQELSNGLAEPHPELMFDALERCGLRSRLLPETRNIPQRLSGPAAVRFAALCWPLQEAEVKSLCDRLRVPNEERELALLACRLRHSLDAAKPVELLEVLKRADAFRRPARFAALLEAAKVARPGFDAGRLERALAAAAAVDAGAIARLAASPRDIAALLDGERVRVIAVALA